MTCSSNPDSPRVSRTKGRWRRYVRVDGSPWQQYTEGVGGRQNRDHWWISQATLSNAKMDLPFSNLLFLEDSNKMSAKIFCRRCCYNVTSCLVIKKGGRRKKTFEGKWKLVSTFDERWRMRKGKRGWWMRFLVLRSLSEKIKIFWRFSLYVWYRKLNVGGIFLLVFMHPFTDFLIYLKK